ncbi:helix-turn-helix domain-containing protein [Staphylococcus lugdunensis]|uniref:helix-turn-helix domain-containing protein n=1 Tax=Staphylococcus lugdunensis TaxID=28035 RepID=UPI00397799C5
MRKEIRDLLNSNITSYEISKETGVSNSVISRLRNGEREIGKVTLETAEKLYQFEMERIKMNKLTYVVDMNKQDKALEIITKEGESFYIYEISPEWQKDKEYLLNLIEDKDLNSKFDSEEIEEPQQFDYTLQDVKDEL